MHIERFDVAWQSGQRVDDVGCRNVTDQRFELQDNNNQANAGHKPGYDGIGHQVDVTPDSQVAKQDLEPARHHYHRESDRRPVSELGEYARRNNRHRAGRAGNL